MLPWCHFLWVTWHLQHSWLATKSQWPIKKIKLRWLRKPILTQNQFFLLFFFTFYLTIPISFSSHSSVFNITILTFFSELWDELRIVNCDIKSCFRWQKQKDLLYCKLQTQNLEEKKSELWNILSCKNQNSDINLQTQAKKSKLLWRNEENKTVR